MIYGHALLRVNVIANGPFFKDFFGKQTSQHLLHVREANNHYSLVYAIRRLSLFIRALQNDILLCYLCKHVCSDTRARSVTRRMIYLFNAR